MFARLSANILLMVQGQSHLQIISALNSVEVGGFALDASFNNVQDACCFGLGT